MPSCPRAFLTIRQLLLLLAILIGLNTVGYSQVPAWQSALSTGSHGTYGNAQVQAVSLDADGNMLLVGYFTGQIAFGATVLSSRGQQDILLAKWNPTAEVWLWALAVGGTGDDRGTSVAVTGRAVYVAGFVTNTKADTNGANNVQFGTVPLNGTGSTANQDAFVARLTQPAVGTPTDWDWALSGGGTGADQALGVAVSGTGVFLAGFIANTKADTNGANDVQFGTVPLNGTGTSSNQDAFVARLSEPATGSPTDWDWALNAGGSCDDQAMGIAVNGAEVYAVGSVNNAKSDQNGSCDVQFGAVPLNGSGIDTNTNAFVAKLTDSGLTSSPAWTWALSGGGNSFDQATAVRVAGNAVFVAGTISNNNVDTNGSQDVQFDSIPLRGASPIMSQDVFVGRLTEYGSSAQWGWVLAGGGQDGDRATGLAIRGTAIYVAGFVTNTNADTNGGNNVQFGTVPLNGTGSGSNQDAFVAQLTEPATGSPTDWDWALGGGGIGNDQALSVAATASGAYVAGYFTGNGSFGEATSLPIGPQFGLVPFIGSVLAGPGSAHWQSVQYARTASGYAQANAMTADVVGNVYVTGNFSGQVSFGNTIVSSKGELDAFVAKWNSTTNTWKWAIGGGGLSDEYAYGIALNGTAVYVTGYVTNNNANTNGSQNVQFGTVPLRGATATNSQDVFLARLTDPVTSPPLTWDWALAGGGTGFDSGSSLAVSGNAVYMTGYIANNSAGINGSQTVQFGSVPVLGTGSNVNNNIFVARVNDPGTAWPTDWHWVLTAGGTGNDRAYGIVAKDDAVYVAGNINNDNADTNGSMDVQFGPIPLKGAGGWDVFVARLNGTATPSWIWAAAAGGSGSDFATSLAVQDAAIYVAGSISNTKADTNGANNVQFGTVPLNGTGSTANQDAFVARLSEPATGSPTDWDWALAGGGTSSFEQANAVAVSGKAIYVGGNFYNDNTDGNGSQDVQFGSVPLKGIRAVSTNDAFLAKVTDPGTTAPTDWVWALAGGSSSDDGLYGIAIRENKVYAAGTANATATFGDLALVPGGAFVSAIMVDAAPLPVQLIRFTARSESGGKVALNWTTASEENSAYFAVERSFTGRDFAQLAMLNAAGTSATAHAYAFTDTSLPSGATLLHYRLRQVDTNGKSVYSPVQSIEQLTTAAGFSVYPTLATNGYVHYHYAAASASQVQIFNMQGQLLRSGKVANGGSGRVSLAELPAGAYILRCGSAAARFFVP